MLVVVVVVVVVVAVVVAVVLVVVFVAVILAFARSSTSSSSGSSLRRTSSRLPVVIRHCRRRWCCRISFGSGTGGGTWSGQLVWNVTMYCFEIPVAALPHALIFGFVLVPAVRGQQR